MKGTSNIFWKRVFVFLTFYLFTFLPLFAQSWPDVKNEARAGSRWWWLGSAVDKDNLQWNLKQYADHGIGSLEITPKSRPSMAYRAISKTTSPIFPTSGCLCSARLRCMARP